MDVPLTIDVASVLISSAALIAGVTPPSVATPQQKKRATSGDFIGRFGLSSGVFVYASQFAVVVLTAVQIGALIQTQNAAETVAASALARWSALLPVWSASRRDGPFDTPPSSHIQAWLVSGRTRRNFRIGCLVGTLGGVLRVVCFRTLGRFFTFDLAVHDGHKVIQSGPYSIVRHPSYTAMLTMCSGLLYANLVYGPMLPVQHNRDTAWCCVTAAVGVVALLISLRIRDEEAMLQKELGAEYSDYMKRVKSRLIPFLL